jgi:uncharacterized protein (TIGR02246 family)
MKTEIFLCAAFAGALFLSQLNVRAADANRLADEQAIRKIEQDWIAAIAKRDAAYMAQIEADDYMLTGPDGKLLNKQEDIKNVTTGDTVFDDVRIDDVKIRFYGDTAIANGLGTIKAHMKQEDLSGQYSWTDVFVKQNGQWKAVAAQVTMVAKETK